MSNGKGPADTRSPNFKARRDGWDRIFGKTKNKKQTKNERTKAK